MRISGPAAELLCDEYDLIAAELPLEGAQVLEPGIGKAEAIPAPDDAFDIVMMFKSLPGLPIHFPVDSK